MKSAIVDEIKEGGRASTLDVDADVAQLKSQQRKAEKERKRLEVYYAKLDAFADFLRTDLNQPNDSIIQYVKENGMEYKDAVIVIMQTLFTGSESFATTLRNRLPLLKEIVAGNREQRFLLGSLERLVGVINPKLLKQLPAILQLLYQHELVEEQVFLLWNESVSRKFVRRSVAEEVRQAAAPFMEWLKTEEEEERVVMKKVSDE